MNILKWNSNVKINFVLAAFFLVSFISSQGLIKTIHVDFQPTIFDYPAAIIKFCIYWQPEQIFLLTFIKYFCNFCTKEHATAKD